MINLYSDADLWDAVMQRRRILMIFWAVTGAWFLGLVAFVAYYCMLPYNDPNATWVIVATSCLTGAYLIFCFPYLGISFKRVNAYCKMLKFISVGLKEYSCMPFSEIEDWTTRDNVDVNVAVFSVYNRKSDEEMFRHIYVDGEKEFPPFLKGQRVKIVSQGNLLISYEILEDFCENSAETELFGQGE